MDDPQTYNSFRNGSAMRVSPVGWAFDTVEDVLCEKPKPAQPSPTTIRKASGARRRSRWLSCALVPVQLKNISARKPQSGLATIFSVTLGEIRPGYRFDETCQKTVPPAIIAFLESDDYEEAVREAVSLGGDADTLAAITGSIAEAFYGGVPEEIVAKVPCRLPHELWGVVTAFQNRMRKIIPVNHP